jgi:hypothetical protein
MENDVLAKTDKHYTHGTKISQYNPAKVFDKYFFEEFTGGLPDTIQKSIFQFMYTPSNIKTDEPQRNDRAWAGILAAEYVEHYNYDIFSAYHGLHLGIVGPNSFAGDTQAYIHQLIGSAEPMGWDNQIGDELYIAQFSTIQFKVFQAKYMDASIKASYYLGNIQSFVSSGVTTRVGYNLPDEMSLYRIEPVPRNMDGNKDFELPPLSLYLIGGADTRYVAWNKLIQNDETDISLEPVVMDYYLGFGCRINRVDIVYLYNIRSAEFKESEVDYHNFGSLTLSYSF